MKENEQINFDEGLILFLAENVDLLKLYKHSTEKDL